MSTWVTGSKERPDGGKMPKDNLGHFTVLIVFLVRTQEAVFSARKPSMSK